jgi:hypothetical protein
VLDHPGRDGTTVRAPAAEDEGDRRTADEVPHLLFDVLAGFGRAAVDSGAGPAANRPVNLRGRG